MLDKDLETMLSPGMITLSYDAKGIHKQVTAPEIFLTFTNEAWTKMWYLVQHYDTEIAFHGYVERDENFFTIYDILVYPQIISHATVESDEEAYPHWLMDIPDNQINNLRMQGHSHVNMGVVPSATDEQHRIEMMTQIKDYYIFLVVNKRQDINIAIFDLSTNIMYETDDIILDVTIAQDVLSKWIKDAQTNIKQYSYRPPVTNTYYDPVGFNDVPEWMNRNYKNAAKRGRKK